MKIHPRNKNVEKARGIIMEKVSGIAVKYKLTHGEMLDILGTMVQAYARDGIREERHRGTLDASPDEA